jgi:hypothetical protein
MFIIRNPNIRRNFYKNNISHLKKTAMKSFFNNQALLIICTLCCLTLENVAQTIVPVKLDVADRSLNKLKSNLKKPGKAGTGITISIKELEAILEIAKNRKQDTVLVFVVGMDKTDKSVWGGLNPGKNESVWDNRPALIIKMKAGSTSFKADQRYPAFINPFTMAMGSGLKFPYQSADYYALGALCPPPIDCTLY